MRNSTLKWLEFSRTLEQGTTWTAGPGMYIDVGRGMFSEGQEFTCSMDGTLQHVNVVVHGSDGSIEYSLTCETSDAMRDFYNRAFEEGRDFEEVTGALTDLLKEIFNLPDWEFPLPDSDDEEQETSQGPQ